MLITILDSIICYLIEFCRVNNLTSGIRAFFIFIYRDDLVTCLLYLMHVCVYMDLMFSGVIQYVFMRVYASVMFLVRYNMLIYIYAYIYIYIYIY